MGKPPRDQGFTNWTQMDPSSGSVQNWQFANLLILWGLMVGERGFEPPTPWSRTSFRHLLKAVEIA